MEMLIILGLAFLFGGFYGVGVAVVVLFVLSILLSLFSN